MSIQDTLRERFDALSERERRLVAAMGATFLILLVLALGMRANRSAEARADAIESGREALQSLLQSQGQYRVNAARLERIEEQLETNDLRLSTFIEARATPANIDRPREFRDRSQPLEDGAVVAHYTTAVFPSMTIEQLYSLLNEVERSEELVFTNQISVEPPRGAASGLQVELTLVTYTLDDAE